MKYVSFLKMIKSDGFSCAREYLARFLDKCGFEENDKEVLTEQFDKLCKDEAAALKFFEAVNRYERTIRPSFNKMFSAVSEIAEKAEIHSYTLNLLLFIFMTKRLKHNYLKRGIPLKMYDDMVLDLKYKSTECRLVKGIVGIFVPMWFSFIFRMEIFSFGILQMQLVKGFVYSGGGIEINKDEYVLSVHIPRTGNRLEKELVDEAYKKASEFFKEKYNLKRIVFICNSWLLFPKNFELLKPASNIYKFISDYKIIEVKYYDDYSDVWRLFDMDYTGDPDALPADTSLRRAYVDIIKRSEKLGSGLGVYVYDKQ